MKYFDVVDGKFQRIRPWPKKLTKKRALQLSIRKWEAFVSFDWRKLFDGSCDTCALCQINYYDCMSCPVYEVTHKEGCEGTPYEDRHENPQLELDFLKQIYLDKYGEEYP